MCKNNKCFKYTDNKFKTADMVKISGIIEMFTCFVAVTWREHGHTDRHARANTDSFFWGAGRLQKKNKKTPKLAGGFPLPKVSTALPLTRKAFYEDFPIGFISIQVCTQLKHEKGRWDWVFGVGEKKAVLKSHTNCKPKISGWNLAHSRW